MKAGRATLIVALAALAIAIGPRSAFAEGDGDVTRALLDAARQSAGISDWESASAYLTEAVSREPGDADVRYLKALSEIKRGRPLEEALGDLNAALSTGRFSYYSARETADLKGELLVRERRWKEALDALGPPSSATAGDPAFSLIRARALAGKGDIGAFLAELREAMNRFPDDPSFPRLFLARAGKVPTSAVARQLGDTILGRLARYAAVDAELPVLAAPIMSEAGARRDAVIAFRASGGKSSAATLLALAYGIIDEAAAASELMTPGQPVSLRDLTSLFNLAGSPAGRGAVAAAVSSWTGIVSFDADGDDVAEGSFFLDAGLVTAWKIETRQDGIFDVKATFIDGLPDSLVLERSAVEITVNYAGYPAVAAIDFKDGSARRNYAFAPEAFSLVPVAMRPFAGEGKAAVFFPYQVPFAEPTERACSASALSVTVDSGSSRTVTLLDKGRPLSATTYADGRVYSETTYDRGRPVIERVDADGDGRFETERHYATAADGTSSVDWLRTDADGDGVYEYREQTVFPFRKEWDYDGNGSVDAVQFQLADGSIQEEFSSRLDGRLDEILVVKNGKISSFSRNGAGLALVPDSNSKLTWIGEKSFDLGPNLPAGEGIFSYSGKRYRLTRVGDLAFGELIP